MRQTEPELGKFVVLDRTRYDLDDKITILGCTLFSRIFEHQKGVLRRGLNDFHLIEKKKLWTTDDHNEQHQLHLKWLNGEIENIEEEGTGKKVVIFTHHSPTTDDRATNPEHKYSELASRFRTDLSQEKC